MIKAESSSFVSNHSVNGSPAVSLTASVENVSFVARAPNSVLEVFSFRARAFVALRTRTDLCASLVVVHVFLLNVASCKTAREQATEGTPVTSFVLGTATSRGNQHNLERIFCEVEMGSGGDRHLRLRLL